MTFEQWLRGQGYAESTVKSTLRMVKTAVHAWQAKESLDAYEMYLKRVAAWAQEHKGSKTAFTEEVLRKFAPPDTRQLESGNRGLGERATEILTDAQWQRLVAALNGAASRGENKHAASVMQVLFALPYPARDLQHRMTQPLADLIRDAPETVSPQLQKMRRYGAKNMAEYLDTKEYSRAYRALHAFLAELGALAGVSRLTFSAVEAVSWRLRSGFEFPERF
jgi:hypothetical protein